MSKYISKYAPHQMVKISNLKQYVAIFPKGTGTGPVPKRVRKIPVQPHENFAMKWETLNFFFFWPNSLVQSARIIGPGHAKMCLMPYATNKGADQPLHPHSLISAFLVHCLDSMICILAISKVSRF